MPAADRFFSRDAERVAPDNVASTLARRNPTHDRLDWQDLAVFRNPCIPHRGALVRRAYSQSGEERNDSGKKPLDVAPQVLSSNDWSTGQRQWRQRPWRLLASRRVQ